MYITRLARLCVILLALMPVSARAACPGCAGVVAGGTVRFAPDQPADFGAVMWSCDPLAGRIEQDGTFHAGSRTGTYWVRADISDYWGDYTDWAQITVVAPVVSDSYTGSGYICERWWGERGPKSIRYPHGVALDAEGNCYITDYRNNRVQKYDPEGNYATSFWVERPSLIAVAPDGTIYVTSAVTWSYYWPNELIHNIVRIDPADSSSTTILDGYYDHAALCALAVDPTTGHLFASKSSDPYYGPEVREYDRDGTLLRRVGSQGIGDGQFSNVRGLACDLSGNLYVVDDELCRISKYDSTGTFVTTWGTSGEGDGQFLRPWAVATDTQGHVYVADPGRYDVQEFDGQGNVLGVCGSYYMDAPFGSGLNPNYNNTSADNLAVDIDRSRYFYCAWSGSGDNCSVWGTSMKPSEISDVMIATSETGVSDFASPSDIAIGASNQVYILDEGSRSVKQFDSQGNQMQQWSVNGFDPTSSGYPMPYSIAVGPSGSVYVGIQGYEWNGWGDCIHQYDPNGDFLREWGSTGSSPGEFAKLSGIAVDQAGNVLAADAHNQRVQTFDSSGTLLSVGPSSGFAWHSPEDIAVDTYGNRMIADSGNDRIWRIAPNGARVYYGLYATDTVWGSRFSLAADPTGGVYVADVNGGGISKFDGSGYLAEYWWPESGVTSLAIDSRGTAFVLSSRVQKLIQARVVTIVTPTVEPEYHTQSDTIHLTGMSDENSGITSLRWSDGHGGSGECLGTASWDTGGIALVPGENTITVTALASGTPVGSASVAVIRSSVTTLGQVKQGMDGDGVHLQGTPPGPNGESATGPIVSAVFSGFFYVESENRSSGLRIQSSESVNIGDRVDVRGMLDTASDSEVFVNASDVSVVGTGDLWPVGMTNLTLGGARNGKQIGIPSATGLNNIGLLVKTWGRYTYVDQHTFTVDDGSNVNLKCVVPDGVSLNQNWNHVGVIGISSCKKVGTELHRLLRVRAQSDITPY